MKKVLFVCSVYKPNLGGVETTIEELAKNYANKGIDSYVLTKRYPNHLSAQEKIGQTKIFRMLRPKTNQNYLDSINFLKKHLIKIEPDIVHVIGIRRPMPLYGLLLARYFQIPFLVTFAGGDLPNPDDPSSLKIWQEGKEIVPQAVKQADGLSTFSKFISDHAQNTFPKLDKPIKIIYAGIDYQKIKQVSPKQLNHPYFFTARRLIQAKGIDLLIKAFHLINQKHPKVKLKIAGEGPQDTDLQNLTSQLNLTNKVNFLGKISHKQVISYLKGALAHICPSRTEGGGIVNFEAQAAGCLAIGSDVGGIPEYIRHNQTGIIFESKDINQLADYLHWAIKDSSRKRRILQNANRKVKKFTWSKFSEKYLNLYSKLVLKTESDQNLRPWSTLTCKMKKRLN